MDRKCRDGGFCFYRLEEPNGLDTYSALSVLHLLGPGNVQPHRLNPDAVLVDGVLRYPGAQPSLL